MVSTLLRRLSVPPPRRVLVVVATLLVAAAIAGSLVAFYVAWCDSPTRWPRERFTAERWAQPGERHRVVRDLVATRRLDGLTRDGVVRLVGRPDGEVVLGQLRYLLKVQDCGIESFWLDVELDDRSRVKSYAIRAE
ncbi:MAG: hypothetical protein L0027_05440 [Candidatus Rokubacteria bacterium]|nr:hypothetical protein [Candidatus Rokubacteria bacterium]